MAQLDGDSDRINIAIDGPAGAGKSTVARLVAGQLGYVYIDTGAMYRAVTFSAQRLSISAEQHEPLSQLMQSIRIELEPGERGQSVFVNGEDVTDKIRSREVTVQVSYFAASGVVRSVLSRMQRDLAVRKGVVMDGRDIGTHVLPNAELKIFLTASVRDRALRRFNELGDNAAITLDQLESEIAERDRLDEGREISPLIRATDAIELDSSGMTIEEVVSSIVQLSRTKLAEAK
ncbi:(d)CMP kinase [Paenibacillus sp. LHD-117]|uniref:(d)CMP kinase n=1 Tax=Paenibacillus sp. LHD-117 TaxID=3071412 RepID=UPI0027DF4D94|nr:(d)CMP kinase [Paenibacillus sp. LHD-117]MDQ6418256.1 (d)CMP kinase [Paenibacillus sp. LHD-117]